LGRLRLYGGFQKREDSEIQKVPEFKSSGIERLRNRRIHESKSSEIWRLPESETY
jgi:hypothetical protein